MPRLWVDKAATMILATGGEADITLSSAIADARFLQATLLRTIIGINIGTTVHDAGEGSQLVSIGIGIANSIVTTSDLPDPEIDTDYPTRGWVWRARYRVFGFAADQPAVFTQRVDLDIRSMRKLENGKSFMIGRNEAIEGTTNAITIHGLIRQLWLVG